MRESVTNLTVENSWPELNMDDEVTHSIEIATNERYLSGMTALMDDEQTLGLLVNDKH